MKKINENTVQNLEQEWQSILIKAHSLPFEKVDLDGDNPLYLLFDEQQPVALLKIDAAEALKQEILGYEVDTLLRFGITPPTAWVDWNETKARLQQFIPNSTTGLQAFADPSLTEALARISPDIVQLAALSGFIKGIGAGHYSNYLLVWDKSDVKKIMEIDLEKIFLGSNKTIDGSPMCRMWILGLPAADLPFNKDLLDLVADPSFFNCLYNLDLPPASQAALKERLEKIIAFAESGGGSPRDLFFSIFGGKPLFEKAQMLGYPNVIIFNEILKYKKIDTLTPFDANMFFLKKKNREKIIENLIRYQM